MVDNLAILGAGSWGTALAYLFSRRAKRVHLWARSQEASREVQRVRHNERYLPGIRLPDQVFCTSELSGAVSGAEIVILAVPSFAIEETSCLLEPHLAASSVVLSAAKGLDCETGRRLSELVEAVVPQARDRLAVLSGPNLAREAAAGMPTATVVAAHVPSVADQIQEALSLPEFRIYTNLDVVGVELGGALKNVIAIAAGITDGLGYGENTKAALVSRGLSEMRRLGRALGAMEATFSGLSGIGDLYATCASSQSRNHRVGFELGQGKSLSDILEGMDQTAEGVPTTRAALALADSTGVEMPITRGLAAVLFQGLGARQSVGDLMTRAFSCEHE